MLSIVKKSFVSIALTSSALLLLSGCQTHSSKIGTVNSYNLGYNEFHREAISGEINACLEDKKCYGSAKFKSAIRKMIHTSFNRGEPEKLTDYGIIQNISVKFDPIDLFNKDDLMAYKGHDLRLIDLKNQLLIKYRDFGSLYSSLLDEIKRNKDERTVQRDSKIIRGMFFHLGCKSEFEVWGRVNSDFDPKLFSVTGTGNSSLRTTMTPDEFKRNASSIVYRDFEALKVSKKCSI